MTGPLNRLMIAATSSGSGKTTLACGLLQVFKNRGLEPAAFKCGPDYIDPMFHRRIVGARSGNLDAFFCDERMLRSLLVRGAEDSGISLIEGVMGFYDGISGGTTDGSSYQVARATRTPVVLALDARGASLSLAATIEGFARFRSDSNIKAVILNACPEGLFGHLAPSLEKHTGIPVVGYLPKNEEYALESRHLGLVTAAEIEGLREKMRLLADTLEETVDIERLIALSSEAPALDDAAYRTAPITGVGLRLGIAQDRAFNFYYEENLRMLAELGLELVPFSPLEDPGPPPGLDGLYLGGGYPELYCEQLSDNRTMCDALRDAIGSGLPTVAECGAFLYLQQAIVDAAGRTWPMAGVLPGVSHNVGSLRHFGYVVLTAQADNLYCKAGESIRAHEFHYWHSDSEGEAFRAQKPLRDSSWPTMVAQGNLLAGFPHVYFPAHPHSAARFVRALADHRAATAGASAERGRENGCCEPAQSTETPKETA